MQIKLLHIKNNAYLCILLRVAKIVSANDNKKLKMN